MEKILFNSGMSPRSLDPLATAALCMQKYAYEHVLKLPRPKTVPLVRGSLVHTGVAHINARKRAKLKGEDPEAYYDPLEAMTIVSREREFGKLGAELYPMAALAMQAYEENYRGDEAVETMVEIERSFDVTIKLPSGEMYEYTQRPDSIPLVKRNGKYLIRDTKTSSQALGGTSVVSQYSTALKMLSYRFIGPILFAEKFGGVEIDLVMVRKKARTQQIEVDFKRAMLPDAPFMVTKFPQIVQDLRQRISQLNGENRDPLLWPPSANEVVCQHKYGECDFLYNCQWGSRVAKVDMANVNISLSYKREARIDEEDNDELNDPSMVPLVSTSLSALLSEKSDTSSKK